MHIFIAVGEVSGDTHGANLMQRFQQALPAVQFSGMGGDAMRAAGQKQSYHIKQLAILGLVEVIRHLPFLRRTFKALEAQFASGEVDAVILVDYPGFNLRLAKIAKRYGLPVFYYICPQMWAWGRRRIYKIRRYVDHSFVIFPFEKEFFARYNTPATFIGHPISEAIARAKINSDGLRRKQKLLALLPGSRAHEIAAVFSVQLEAAQRLLSEFPDWDFVVAKAAHLEARVYGNVEADRLIENRHYDILGSADAAIVTSGTATLECTVFGIPYVITYKVNRLTWWLGQFLVKIPFIGMANILSQREVVPEVLQNDLRPDVLVAHMRPLMQRESPVRDRQKADLAVVREQLAGEHASAIAVNKMLEILNGQRR
jgi:lipid-A-disaccharide synthase